MPVWIDTHCHLDANEFSHDVPDVVAQAAAAGVLAIGFDLEGAMPLLEQPEMVAVYRALGVRQTTVAPAPSPGWGFHRNLADHLLLGEPLAVRPEESRDVVAVLEAGHRSGKNGGELVEIV